MSVPSHEVLLLNTGERFACKLTESVLHGMARLRKRGIPVGCRGGGCGVCKVQVVHGQYTKRVMSRAHVTEHDEAQFVALACRITPDSDLQIRVLGAMQKALARSGIQGDPRCIW